MGVVVGCGTFVLPHLEHDLKHWRCTTQGIRGESEVREGIRGESEAREGIRALPKRNSMEELHDQRWKVRARSTSIAQAMAHTSTRGTTPLRHTTPITVCEEGHSNTQIQRGKAGRLQSSSSPIRECMGWRTSSLMSYSRGWK
jgi:hypothetical protein